MNEWGYIDTWAKKYKAVQFLGGRCVRCGNDDFRILQFHHKNGEDKDFTIRNIKNTAYSFIEKEVKKCVLLCPNCHMEEHNNIEFKKVPLRRIAKKRLLELKGVNKCNICGYDKFIGSLDFHHRNGEKKKFIISDVNKVSKIEELGIILLDELDKCDVICKNCHALIHINVNRVEKYFDKIISKKWRNNNKAPKDEIIDLYNNGYKQFEIVKLLNVPKSTVCTIVKYIGD